MRWMGATVVVLGFAGVWGGGAIGRGLDGGQKTAGRTVEFAGRTWQVKAGKNLGPGPNDFSDSAESVRVDAEGHLHLAILPNGASSTCAEVVSPASLGYGEYRWTIDGKLPALDARTVVGLFTYEDDEHEIDFEVSRWGEGSNDNCQFVLQPYAPDSIRRFDAGPAGRLTASFDWRPDGVRFRCWAGDDATGKPLREWTYNGPKVPRPGKERCIMNFWVLDGRPSPGAPRQDVTIRSFEFRPRADPAP